MRAAAVVQVLHGLFYVLLHAAACCSCNSLKFYCKFYCKFYIVVVIPPLLVGPPPCAACGMAIVSQRCCCMPPPCCFFVTRPLIDTPVGPLLNANSEYLSEEFAVRIMRL